MGRLELLERLDVAAAAGFMVGPPEMAPPPWIDDALVNGLCNVLVRCSHPRAVRVP